MNLLSLDCNNTRIGSGGYGYTAHLPGDDFDPDHVRPHDMWGCSNAQIFSEVSPEMHWEFALEHDLRWLERWGLTYYGCCEPLDQSRWTSCAHPQPAQDLDEPRGRTRPAWSSRSAPTTSSPASPTRPSSPRTAGNPEQARQELREFLDATRGCHVELIMKDISTVRYEPQRLWEWASMAMEVAEDFAD